MTAQSLDIRRLRAAYSRQRSQARVRGIGWEFDNFEHWLRFWIDSGRLAQRGSGRGRYVMARRGDVGPYSPENVEIILHEANSRDARSNHPEETARSARLVSAKNLGRGRGWTIKAGGYQVVVSDKYIGRFSTQAAAEAAYRAACEQYGAVSEAMED